MFCKIMDVSNVLLVDILTIINRGHCSILGIF